MCAKVVYFQKNVKKMCAKVFIFSNSIFVTWLLKISKQPGFADISYSTIREHVLWHVLWHKNWKKFEKYQNFEIRPILFERARRMN